MRRGGRTSLSRPHVPLIHLWAAAQPPCTSAGHKNHPPRTPKKYRVAYCARTSPLPLLPSGPGGVGGITSRRTRHLLILAPAAPLQKPRSPKVLPRGSASSPLPSVVIVAPLRNSPGRNLNECVRCACTLPTCGPAALQLLLNYGGDLDAETDRGSKGKVIWIGSGWQDVIFAADFSVRGPLSTPIRPARRGPSRSL